MMSPKPSSVPRRLARAALDRAYRRVGARLGSAGRGRVVALDAATGIGYLGATIEEALGHARTAAPDGYFLVRRVGYPAVFRLKSRP